MHRESTYIRLCSSRCICHVLVDVHVYVCVQIDVHVIYIQKVHVYVCVQIDVHVMYIQKVHVYFYVLVDVHVIYIQESS